MRAPLKSQAPPLCIYMDLNVTARKDDYNRHYENKWLSLCSRHILMEQNNAYKLRQQIPRKLFQHKLVAKYAYKQQIIYYFEQIFYIWHDVLGISFIGVFNLFSIIDIIQFCITLWKVNVNKCYYIVFSNYIMFCNVITHFLQIMTLSTVWYLCLLVVSVVLFFWVFGYQCGLWGWRQWRACEFLKKKAVRPVRWREGGLLATCGLHNPGTNHRGTWQSEWQMNNAPIFQPPVNRPIHHGRGD